VEKAKSYRCGASFSLLVGGQESASASAERLVLLVGGDFDFGGAERGAAQSQLRP
jgi:hypothetical protein